MTAEWEEYQKLRQQHEDAEQEVDSLEERLRDAEETCNEIDGKMEKIKPFVLAELEQERIDDGEAYRMRQKLKQRYGTSGVRHIADYWQVAS